MLRFDYNNALDFFRKEELEFIAPQVTVAHVQLHQKSGAGSEYLGWVDLPAKYDKAEFARIRKAAAKIRKDSDILIVIGIGGSYLGARAAIELLTHSFNNTLSKRQRKGPQIIFAGNSISSTYLADLFDLLEGKDVSLNVISKSGTTTEPALAFRILKTYMEEKYGKEGACSRIYATTDRARGALKGLADNEGYETFVVPDDVGGRYSILTAVGLLPIAAAGIDIRDVMQGAKDAMKEYKNPNLEETPATCMLQPAMSCSGKATTSRSWSTMNPACTFSPNGGNSFSAKAKAKTAKAFSRPASTIQPTCIPWASISRMASASCLRP